LFTAILPDDQLRTANQQRMLISWTGKPCPGNPSPGSLVNASSDALRRSAFEAGSSFAMADENGCVNHSETKKGGGPENRGDVQEN
jgi:hypothetical protein